jgi:hypothetical protein
MTKALVAAVAALLTVINLPASAQNENAAKCPPGRNCRPPPPPQRPVYVNPPPAYVDQPPIYIDPPRFCVVNGGRGSLGTHDVTGRRVCRVVADPGTYCECPDGFGGVLEGIVQ